MQALTDLWRRSPALAVSLAIAILVALRLLAVVASPLEIGPDESQYWRWGQSLDFGYYSKPPLIAWAIALSTGIFGDAEWAIRFFSPILHGIAAFILFLLGQRMFEARIGAWAAAIYLLMPGIWLSSTIMSTDAVLLPACSAALYFLWRMREQPTLVNGALAGAMIGLAMLGKYAALYLFAGPVLAALFDREARRALLSPAGLATVVGALAVLSPNLIWNANHGFATVSHTADNANLAAAGFNPSHIFSFIGDQMAVFGPILFLVLLAGFALIAGRNKETRARELWLLCFIVPVMLVILGQEIMSRAHANWAAVAYPACSVLVASWIGRAFGREPGKVKAGPFIKTGVGLNTVIGLIFAVLWVAPKLGDAIGGENAYKRVRGWEQTSTELARIAAQNNATAILFDEREVWHGVDYYGRSMVLPPVRAWQVNDQPRSHAEIAGMLQPGEDARVLVASTRSDFRPRIRADFDRMEPAGTLTIPVGPTKTRDLKLYIASGYHHVPRTPDYYAKFDGVEEN